MSAMEDKITRYYGVWLKSGKWMKLPDPSGAFKERAYTTANKEEADFYARKVKGETRPIDRQLEAGEKIINQLETVTPLWERITKLVKGKNGSNR